jgi:lysophospholipid acyltransferase (LPLAT)-like uncharacterized protein
MQADSSSARDDLLAATQPVESAGSVDRTRGSASPSPERDPTASPPKSRRARRGDSEANVAALRRRVYAFHDLSGYRLRDRVVIRAADLFFYLLIRLICITLRWETRGLEHLDAIFSSGHRAIFTFWHVCIFSATWYWRKRGIVVMSSQSRDGEFTGRFIRRFGYGTARGSATRGASRALTEMAQCLTHGMDAAFTIDGPRGPAYVAKSGAVTLARHTGQAILPFHIAARRTIELPSWDRLQIPLPFTRAVAFIAEPIYVPRDADKEMIADKQAALQAALDRLRAEAARWHARRDSHTA